MLKYLRQIAVITPYAQFRFRYMAQDDRNSVAITFVRRTLKMPVPPAVRAAVCSKQCLDTPCTPGAGRTGQHSAGVASAARLACFASFMSRNCIPLQRVQAIVLHG